MNWTVLFQIFSINLIYIMLNTMRVILTTKGYRNVAPLVGIIEVIVYTLGLSMVMKFLDNPIYLIAYAVGFGVGTYIGILIEDKIALGYSAIQIFSPSDDHRLANNLRELGYGVTVQPAYGRDGDRLVLTVLTPRSNERALYQTIEEIDPSAFYISYDAKVIHGGFWSKRVNPLDFKEGLSKLQGKLNQPRKVSNQTKDEFIR